MSSQAKSIKKGESTESDSEIITRVKDGQTSAFEYIVDRYKNKAMTLCVRMLKSRSDAEDALQEAFILAFRSLDRFEQRSTFSTWFYRIVYNVCAGELRKRNIRPAAIENEESLFEIGSSDYLPDDCIEEHELSQIIEQELLSMPQHYASVLTLYHLENMSYEQISVVTQLPMGTVKTQLFRARAMLRQRVESHYAIDANIE